MKLSFIFIVLASLVIIYVIVVIYFRTRLPLFMKENLKIEFYDLMRQVDVVLTQDNIRYVAVAGTLLGAVRHAGFIPWDDDIDIGIPDDDLEKLQSLDLAKYGLYGVGIEKTNTGRIYFANNKDETRKMHAVFVDVFILEKNGDKWEYANPEAKASWPNEYFFSSELSPLKKYDFGFVKINGPNTYESYCSRAWGLNWRKPQLKVSKMIIYPVETFKMLFSKPIIPS